ncbi:hypothetical protein IWQ62_000843 [Dispira parvispora]|uniref:RGS domain-containing protein n=1 Tax=Dispira parvispora TaxID=1520584 RepID=A0A9W8AZB6_9FUNG|nr:hypothetical protein IWQ62_000843 [Dispira parvispora]
MSTALYTLRQSTEDMWAPADMVDNNYSHAQQSTNTTRPPTKYWATLPKRNRRSTVTSFTVSNFTRAVVNYAKFHKALPPSVSPAQPICPPTPLETPSVVHSPPSISPSPASVTQNMPLFPTGSSLGDLWSNRRGFTSPSRRVRGSFLKSLRQRRASVHIASYVRITAMVTPVQMFPVTVKKTDSIEELARHIEAEYAFRYPTGTTAVGSPDLNEVMQTNCDLPFYGQAKQPQGTSSPSSSSPAKEGTVHLPLVCGALLVSDTPLVFESQVGDVLNMDDVVQVVNLNGADDDEPDVSDEQEITEAVVPSALTKSPATTTGQSMVVNGGTESDVLVTPTSDTALSDFHRRSVDTLGSFASAVSDTALRAALHQAPAVTLPETCLSAVPELEPGAYKSQALFSVDRLPRLALPHVRFHNLLRLPNSAPYFLHFCLEAGEFAVESALFWLDVERFRQTSSNVCRLMANYIYITYLIPQAPLFVNISSELRQDIPWPFGSGWEANTEVFDEAQEWVFQMMKHRLLRRFEQSEDFQDMFHDERFIPQEYVSDHEVLDESAFAWCPVDLDTVLWINDVDHNHNDSKLAAELGRLSDESREDLIRRIMGQFHPLPTSLARTQGYFTHPRHISILQKGLRRQRNKRLLKFFGDKPEEEALISQSHLPVHDSALLAFRKQQKSRSGSMSRLGDHYGERNIVGHTGSPKGTVPLDTLGSAAGRGEAELQSGHRLTDSIEPQELPARWESASLAPSFTSSLMGDPHWDTYNRKKKLEKLREFFGDRIPMSVLVEQQLVDADEEEEWAMVEDNSDRESSADEDYLPRLPNGRELTQEEKRVLTKRHRKLKYMLGEPLGAATVAHNVTNPYLRYSMDRRRSHSISETGSVQMMSPTTVLNSSVTLEAPPGGSHGGKKDLKSGRTPPPPVHSVQWHEDAMSGGNLSLRRGQEPLELEMVRRAQSSPASLLKSTKAASQETCRRPGHMEPLQRGTSVDYGVTGDQSTILGSSDYLYVSPSLPDLRCYDGPIPLREQLSPALVDSEMYPKSKLGSKMSHSEEDLSPMSHRTACSSLQSSQASLPPAVKERAMRRRQMEKLRDVLGPNVPLDSLSGDARNFPECSKNPRNRAPAGSIGGDSGVKKSRSAFFHERIPSTSSNPNSLEMSPWVTPNQQGKVLTPEEKAVHMKRANKLERMFGEHLPTRTRLQLIRQMPAHTGGDRDSVCDVSGTAISPGLRRSSMSDSPALRPGFSRTHSHSRSYSGHGPGHPTQDVAQSTRPSLPAGQHSAMDRQPSNSSVASYSSTSSSSSVHPSSLPEVPSEARRGEIRRSLTMFLDDEEAVSDFIEYVTEVTLSRRGSAASEKVGHLATKNKGAGRVPVTVEHRPLATGGAEHHCRNGNPAQVSDSNRNSDDENGEDELFLASKRARQRRLLKLHQFFGDAPSSESLLAQNILFTRLEPLIEHQIHRQLSQEQYHPHHQSRGVRVGGSSSQRGNGGATSIDTQAIKRNLKQDLKLFRQQMS